MTGFEDIVVLLLYYYTLPGNTETHLIKLDTNHVQFVRKQ